MVDDEPDIRTIGVLALETVGGFCVKQCESGADALESIAAFKPDLILLDVMMPGLDGRATLQRLRELPEGKDLPVIFFTAKTHADEIAALKRLGAVAVMSKPFDPMTLATDIKHVWEDATQGVPAAVDPVAAKMEELKASFRERAIESMHALSDALKLLEADKSSDKVKETLRDIRGIAHKLAGRGGTFGFPEISEVGSQLELAVYDVLDAEDPCDPSNQERMRNLVTQLNSVISANLAA